MYGHCSDNHQTLRIDNDRTKMVCSIHAFTWRLFSGTFAAYLTLRHMRVLVAVAEQGGVVKAAQSLHLAQPAISRSLHQLENALGMPLFDRSPRGMTLTIFGEVLVRRVRTVFCELRDAGEELTSLQDMSYGRLSIGCTPLLTVEAMPRVLSAMLAARPGLALSVLEGDSTTLLRELRLRNIDMALARLPPPASLEPDLTMNIFMKRSYFSSPAPTRRWQGAVIGRLPIP